MLLTKSWESQEGPQWRVLCSNQVTPSLNLVDLPQVIVNSLPLPNVLACLIASHLFLCFVVLHHMVIIILSQLIEEKISLLKELMNHENNRPQVTLTYQIQIDTIRSIDDYDLQKVESIILQKK